MKRIFVIGNIKSKDEIQKVQEELESKGNIVFGMYSFEPMSSLMYEARVESLKNAEIVYVVKEEGIHLDSLTASIVSKAKEFEKIILYNGKFIF